AYALLICSNKLSFHCIESVSQSERSVAALTGLPRTEWARIQKESFTSGINKDNMTLINKAVFMVILLDRVPEDINDKAKTLLHGDGKSFWYVILLVYRSS
ncbi:hypothetical protein SK128_017992, partial [Halocaridina rubra]